MNDAEQVSDDDAIRRVVGLVLRAAERGETDALLESVEDPASRLFLSEIASYAKQERTGLQVPPTDELDTQNPTSAELLLEEELEDDLTLADPLETDLLVWLAQRQEAGAGPIWERTLLLLAEERQPS